MHQIKRNQTERMLPDSDQKTWGMCRNMDGVSRNVTQPLQENFRGSVSHFSCIVAELWTITAGWEFLWLLVLTCNQSPIKQVNLKWCTGTSSLVLYFFFFLPMIGPGFGKGPGKPGLGKGEGGQAGARSRAGTARASRARATGVSMSTWNNHEENTGQTEWGGFALLQFHTSGAPIARSVT